MLYLSQFKWFKNIRFGLLVTFLTTFFFSQTGWTQVLPSYQLSAVNHQLPTLRYLSINPANPNNYFNFLMDKGGSVLLRGAAGDETILSNNLTAEAKKLINYFFLGITLPSDSFWVNLQPKDQERMTSKALSHTDMGKVLLEQDLLLKKDVAKYLNPDNPVGKKFWEALYSQIDKNKIKKEKIITSQRVWITPDKATVVETADGAFVSEAKLKVLLENEYLKISPQDQIHILSEKLMKEIVIPQLVNDINNSSRYAPLRQVYYSLVLAGYFKQKNTKSVTQNPYVSLINSQKTEGLQSQAPWSKDKIFQEYLTSYSKGEYNLKRSLLGIARMYVSGGVTDLLPKVDIVGSSTINTLAANGTNDFAAVMKLGDGVSGDINLMAGKEKFSANSVMIPITLEDTVNHLNNIKVQTYNFHAKKFDNWHKFNIEIAEGNIDNSQPSLDILISPLPSYKKDISAQYYYLHSIDVRKGVNSKTLIEAIIQSKYIPTELKKAVESDSFLKELCVATSPVTVQGGQQPVASSMLDYDEIENRINKVLNAPKPDNITENEFIEVKEILLWVKNNLPILKIPAPRKIKTHFENKNSFGSWVWVCFGYQRVGPTKHESFFKLTDLIYDYLELEALKKFDPIKKLKPATSPLTIEEIKSIDPFLVSHSAYAELWNKANQESSEKSSEVSRIWSNRVDELHGEWIKAKLEGLNANWMLVCGPKKEILDYSINSDRYPSSEEIERIGNEKGYFPFIFSAPPLIEEIHRGSSSVLPELNDLEKDIFANEFKKIGDLFTDKKERIKKINIFQFLSEVKQDDLQENIYFAIQGISVVLSTINNDKRKISEDAKEQGYQLIESLIIFVKKILNKSTQGYKPQRYGLTDIANMIGDMILISEKKNGSDEKAMNDLCGILPQFLSDILAREITQESLNNVSVLKKIQIELKKMIIEKEIADFYKFFYTENTGSKIYVEFYSIGYGKDKKVFVETNGRDNLIDGFFPYISDAFKENLKTDLVLEAGLSEEAVKERLLATIAGNSIGGIDLNQIKTELKQFTQLPQGQQFQAASIIKTLLCVQGLLEGKENSVSSAISGLRLYERLQMEKDKVSSSISAEEKTKLRWAAGELEKRGIVIASEFLKLLK